MPWVEPDRIKRLQCYEECRDDFTNIEHVKKKIADEFAAALVDKLFEFRKVAVQHKDNTTIYHAYIDIIVPKITCG